MGRRPRGAGRASMPAIWWLRWSMSAKRRRQSERPRLGEGRARPAVGGPPPRTGPTSGRHARTRSGWRGSGSSTPPDDAPDATGTGPVPGGLAPPESGNQIAGTRSRRDNSANTNASIRSVLHANGASPFTFAASAISTSQPASSSVSCTNRAPFIDSITARTGPCAR